MYGVQCERSTLPGLSDLIRISLFSQMCDLWDFFLPYYAFLATYSLENTVINRILRTNLMLASSTCRTLLEKQMQKVGNPFRKQCDVGEADVDAQKSPCYCSQCCNLASWIT